jgi:hypothetical protein
LPNLSERTKVPLKPLSSKEVEQRMRILIYCPTAPRLEKEVVESILNQTYDGYYDIVFTRDNPYDSVTGRIWRNVQMAYDKMKQLTIQQGYDKVWIVESDTIPPKDALKKLMEIDAPAVSGLYALRSGVKCPNVRNPQTTSHFRWDFIKEHWGETIETSGGCMGCLLLDRSVVENFNFIDETNPNAPDVPLMEWMWKTKQKQMARLDVVCGHKRPSGEILWPDKENGFIIERN